MQLLARVNRFSYNLFGIPIIDAWKQTPQTKAASQTAQRLAQNKHLREAVTIATQALAFWPKTPNFWQRWICKLLMGNLLDNLNQESQQWRNQLAMAEQLAASAATLLQQDRGDPWETQMLHKALSIYQRCSTINHDEGVLEAINQCQQELQKRQQFQDLVRQAQLLEENCFFKKAIANYQQAARLYSTAALAQAITTANTQVSQEEIYDSRLQVARQAEATGKLRSAIALLESAVEEFPRADGLELLQKLKLLVKGRDLFRQGLTAEKNGDFFTAISFYESAKYLLPDDSNCRLRLALVTIKTQQWEQSLAHLRDLPGEQAAYLRGFAYAQQENLQQAYREWQEISGEKISLQRETLKTLSQRHRLLSLQNIEALVTAEKLEEAKIASSQFLQKFGANPLVEDNLKQHIQPRLEAAVWQSSNWELISEKATLDWLNQPHITTVHNWAIANYYHAQKDIKKIPDLIISLSTAMANLHQDTALADVLWLGNKSVDFAGVFNQLKQRLEATIDKIKDSDLEIYLSYRDSWRLENLALELMGQPATRGLQINDIFVTPGCYSHYLPHTENGNIRQIDTQHKILHCLYTNWGLAVAACICGDTERAIKIKPVNKRNSSSEIFAQKFIAYYEGCYYLQQQQWREAIYPLKQAKSEIANNLEWQVEIDRLCSLHRQNIFDEAEHLDFAQFWYDIFDSSNARAYLAEYKAEKIREKLANEQISETQALKELEKLLEIDAENPIVLDLIERIKVTQAISIVEGYLDSHNLEAAVKYAQEHSHQKIKNMVAEICLDIFIQGFKSRKLGFAELYELGCWAYELCPDEPTIQEIDKISRELMVIHNLLQSDRLSEAVYTAKYSEYDSIRSYVADYLIMTLVKGLQNKTLPNYLMYDLGHGAYELSPDEPEYQEIYQRLNLI